MLEINPETVCFLINRAKVFHAQEEVVIPTEPESPGDDWAVQILADHEGDLTYQEFRETVEDLEPDQQIALVALMWVGRGIYAREEWDAALAEAGAERTRRTAEYLLATPLVADYLEEGLATFDYRCDD